MNRVLRHRLRNFASGIKSASTFLSKELADRLDPSEMEYFPLILNECDALSDLTSRLSLLFDEVPPGGGIVARDLLQELAARFHERFPTRQIEMEAEAAFQALPLVSGAWISLPLMEMLVNSAEAAPAKPVRLEGALEGASVIFRVRDQGPGLSEEDARQCLKPFHTTKARHMGIGLPIALRLIARLDGKLKAERGASGGFVMEVSWPADKLVNSGVTAD